MPRPSPRRAIRTAIARRGAAPRAWLVALLLVAGVAPAQAAWMVPPNPYRAKDFAIIKHEGWYHCFYTQAQTSAPYDSTERVLGHARSRDLYIWTHLPPVLPVRLDKWDNAKVWAPHILKVDGVFYMFYTGVTNTPGVYAFHQRIGVATSTDLMTWNRLDEPVFACEQVRWSYCDPLMFGGGEFRDAFVMPDGSGPGWLMYYTAAPASHPNTFVAGTAFSAGDLTQWVNGPPLWITHDTWSGSPVVESPHVFSHNGLYYLLFTGSGSEPIRILTGTDPVGGPASWTPRGTLGAMLGFNTSQWIASEFFQDGIYEHLCFVNFDRVDIRQMVWGAGWQFTLVQPPLFHVQSLGWSAPSVDAGETIQLTIEAVNTFGAKVHLEAFEVDADGSMEPIPPVAIGLPDSIAMTGPTTVYHWVARGWPDPEEADENAEILVRLKDRTAEAPPLTVRPDPWVPVGSGLPGDGNPRVPREYVEFARAGTGDAFRVLRRSPIGAIALLVELGQPTEVRLDLFDVAGRRVRRLADGTLPAGATVIPWDGRERDGGRAPGGVYFARLTTSEGPRTLRLALTP